MNFNELLKPLAASLSEEIWTHDALKAHLERRFPERARKHAAPLALALTVFFPGGVAPAPRLIAAFLTTRHEFRSLWAKVRTFGQRPNYPLSSPGFRPDPALAALGPPALADTGALADWLALSPDQLVRFSDLHALSALNPSPYAGHYRQHLIPKKSGGLRLIEEPKPFLKKLQRRLLSGLLDRVPPHPTAYGFTKGRNCLQAAQRHVGEEVVVGFDLSDFFPSITFSRIFSLFRTLGYPAPVARHLAGLTTTVAPLLARAVPEIVHSEGFRPNPAKTRVMTAGQRQTVTGLTVNRHVNVARAEYDRLKAVLHRLGDPTDARRSDLVFLAQLSGRVGWVEQVNPARGMRLRERFEALWLC